MRLPDLPRYPIHDLYIRSLAHVQSGHVTSLRLVGHSDHLLRRFGWAELLRVTSGETVGPCLQPIADDVWILESGEAELFWRDERPRSPTQGRQLHHHAKAPLLWLVPFGVSFGLRSRTDCVVVRLSSHEQPEGGGETTSDWPEDW